MAFRASEGSFAAFLGMPTAPDPEREAKKQAARMGAMRAALEVLEVGDPKRDAIEAKLAQHLGGGQAIANAVTAIRPRATQSQTAAQRLREQKIQDQMQLNKLTRAQATDVVDKNVRITDSDPFGNRYQVNIATGERELIAGPGTQGPRPSAVAAQPAERPEAGMSPIEAAAEGTGPVAATLQGVSNLFGFMFQGQIAPRTTEARQTLGLFNKTMQRTLINNPRFPVAEQEFVRGLMPDPASFFKDPDDAVANVRKLESHVNQQIDIKTQELQAPGLTSARKVELSDQISALREIQRMFPDGNAGQFSEMSVDDLMNVDVSNFTLEQAREYEAALDRALQ